MLKKIIVSLVAVLMMAGFLAVVPSQAQAADCDGGSIRACIDCAPANTKGQTVQEGIRIAVNTLLFVVGVASVIVLIVGGLRFILAGGNASSVASARDSILYAVIGIVVALLAYAIVNFVLGQFGA
jgi:hypothetical protein